MKLSNVISTVVTLFVVFAASVGAQDRKVSIDELKAKHPQSVGKASGLANGPGLLEGKVVFSEIIGRNISLDGTSLVLSQGQKFKCSFRFGVRQYTGEQLVFDGQNGMVGMIDSTSRSNLGTFLYLQEDILREGLFGGTLSTAWPLLDIAQKGAKLKYEGIRKIQGRELHHVIYIPKKEGGNGDLSIHLYFELETFRHVMTVYAVTIHNSAGSSQEGTDEIKQTLEEYFGDFRETDGLTLPFHWTVRYRVTPQSKTQEFQWESKFRNVRTLPAN